jgi:hypothetical protein
MTVNKENSAYVKLLSSPDFDFTPFFDEAVLAWLRENMARFLAEQPQACHLFFKSEEHLADVAQAIPLDDEQNVAGFLQALPRDYSYSVFNAFQIICRRLADAKLTKQILNVPNDYFYWRSDYLAIFNALSNDDLTTLITRLDHNRFAWGPDTINLCMTKMPPECLKLFMNDHLLRSLNYVDRQRTISILAQKLPYDDMLILATVYLSQFSELNCMSCGRGTIKSRSGYSIHRKSCDRQDKYPNLVDTVASRMKKGI